MSKIDIERKWQTFLKIISISFIIIGLFSLILSFVFFLSNREYFSFGEDFNLDMASKFGGYLSGIVGIFFAGTGTFLVFLTFEQQRRQFINAQYESSFFHLLSHLENIINNMSGIISDDYNTSYPVNGRKYINSLVKEYSEYYNGYVNRVKSSNNKFNSLEPVLVMDQLSLNRKFDKKLFQELVSKVYKDFFTTNASILGHYFRFVYNIINYIDNSPLRLERKQLYINLIQAQMSNDELALILLNGLGKYGHEKFYPLLEDYNFLSNIGKNTIPNLRLLSLLYPKTSFKNIETPIKNDLSRDEIKYYMTIGYH